MDEQKKCYKSKENIKKENKKLILDYKCIIIKITIIITYIITKENVNIYMINKRQQ